MMPLLWVDVETTGLCEHDQLLLEVGLILTNEELEVAASASKVIGYKGIRGLSIFPEVTAMHEANGLFDVVERSKNSRTQVEEALLGFVKRYDCAGLPMAGSGVHFDRRWLKWWMPSLAKQWSYRTFDMTTLRYFFSDEKKEGPHRALGDLRENIATLRRYAGSVV